MNRELPGSTPNKRSRALQDGDPSTAKGAETAADSSSAAPESAQAAARKPAAKKLGEYRIVREIGRGAMGSVFEAVQENLGRKVAVKVLRGAAMLDDRSIRRFRREAEAVARLHHTNIVPVYSVGEQEGTHYYAMELVEGVSLAEVIRHLRGGDIEKSNPFDPRSYSGHSAPSTAGSSADVPTIALDDSRDLADLATRKVLSQTRQAMALNRKFINTAVGMIADVADALHHAHDQGIIHRDIKPANMLLAGPGKLMLSDFGLARQQGGRTLTLTGDFMGTPMYMSPEQALAGRAPLDHRTDIYSLGVTLYELLTLSTPYEGTETHTLLRDIITKEPPGFRKLNVRLPRDLELVTLKAMEKDPDRRYQTAQEFADDLRRFLNYEAVEAKPIGTLTRCVRALRRHRTNVAIAASACLVVLLLAGAAGWYGHRQRAARLQIYLERGDQLLQQARSMPRRADRLYDSAAQQFVAALAVDPNNEVADAALTELYLDRCRRALEGGQYDVARGILVVLRQKQLDPDSEAAKKIVSFERQARGTGTWKVETEPPGCTVALAAIDESFQAGEYQEMGTSPLTTRNIAMGNYLVRFSHPDFVDVHYPMLIERNEAESVVVKMLRPDQVPEGMAYVPAGEFQYGDPDSGEARKTYVDGYFIDRTEVTGAEYEKFVQETEAAPPTAWGRSTTCPPPLRDAAVYNVSWFEAMDYARWAGKRLPTGPEWEKAARGVDGRRYPWGNRFDPRACNWREANASSADVGRWPAGQSVYGCLDMAGNVWEWTTEREKTFLVTRVMRGGAAYSESHHLMSYLRSGQPPAGSAFGAMNLTGFRCAKSLIDEGRSEHEDVIDELELGDDYAQACQIYGNFAISYNTPRYWDYLLKCIDKLLELNPRSVTAHYWKAGYCEQHEKLDEALDAYRTVYVQDPTYRATPRDLPAVIKKLEEQGKQVEKEFLQVPKWYAAAARAIANQQYAEAEQLLAKILEIDPKHGAANEKMGDVLVADGRAEEANEHFERRAEDYRAQLREDSGNAGLYNEFAWFLAKRRLHLDEGIRMAQRSLELAPDAPAVLDTLAELKFASGQVAEAIGVIQQAIVLSPHDDYLMQQLQKFQAAQSVDEKGE